MSERGDLLISVAGTINTYRQGELATPTPDHVDRWVSQFTQETQVPFLREFDHVIKQTFFTKASVLTFLSHLVRNVKLAGADPAAYWATANFLRIQRDGQSQKEMVSLFGECLEQQCNLKLGNCGSEGGDYIYLDDVMFTGNRIASDLEVWIAEKAPAKAVVHVIVMALHTSAQYYLRAVRLKKAIAASKKNIELHFWRSIELENQKNRKNDSAVLWPASVPNDPAVQAYVAAQRFPLEPRQPGGNLGVFSSEQGRNLLEQEFLVASVRIRSLTQNPKDFVKPLGFGGFGVGFGSTIATYRNCPNNCPLAMWWGDPAATSGALHWYPLLSRKTYASAENVFNAFDDLTL